MADAFSKVCTFISPLLSAVLTYLAFRRNQNNDEAANKETRRRQWMRRVFHDGHYWARTSDPMLVRHVLSLLS